MEPRIIALRSRHFGLHLEKLMVRAACVLAVAGAFATPARGQTTATVAGTVNDAQGRTIPGATVTLLSESRGTSLDAQTTTTGDFVFPDLTGDTYTVKVTMDGFKTSQRRGASVSAGDRVVVGTVVLEVGELNEIVTVSGDAPLTQAQTGVCSFTSTYSTRSTPSSSTLSRQR